MDCHSEPDRTIFTVRSAAKNLRHCWGRFFTPLRSVQNDRFHLIHCDPVLVFLLIFVQNPANLLLPHIFKRVKGDFPEIVGQVH